MRKIWLAVALASAGLAGCGASEPETTIGEADEGRVITEANADTAKGYVTSVDGNTIHTQDDDGKSYTYTVQPPEDGRPASVVEREN